MATYIPPAGGSVFFPFPGESYSAPGGGSVAFDFYDATCSVRVTALLSLQASVAVDHGATSSCSAIVSVKPSVVVEYDLLLIQVAATVGVVPSISVQHGNSGEVFVALPVSANVLVQHGVAAAICASVSLSPAISVSLVFSGAIAARVSVPIPVVAARYEIIAWPSAIVPIRPHVVAGYGSKIGVVVRVSAMRPLVRVSYVDSAHVAVAMRFRASVVSRVGNTATVFVRPAIKCRVAATLANQATGRVFALVHIRPRVIGNATVRGVSSHPERFVFTRRESRMVVTQ